MTRAVCAAVMLFALRPTLVRHIAPNYATGQFYDISRDVEERSPLDDNARRVRTMLRKVLDKYKDARPKTLR